MNESNFDYFKAKFVEIGEVINNHPSYKDFINCEETLKELKSELDEFPESEAKQNWCSFLDDYIAKFNVVNMLFIEFDNIDLYAGNYGIEF